ncbi:MAG: DUF4167 domain-containing protein [Proteobacteria bacterium]|nr:DUF4167 domain-containing protein [Pseudomonadota bacterium]
MRNGQNQNKRMRGRSRKTHNPLGRVFESNGPDVKIRGTPMHIAEKYMQLARDAHSSSDPVAAENYFQHAEHYFRMIATAQDQFRQNNPYFQQGPTQGAADSRDDDDEGEEEPITAVDAGEQPSFGTRDPQPFIPRDAQFYPTRDSQQGGRPQGGQNARPSEEGNVDRLPSFITGGQAAPSQPVEAPNGHDNERQGDRFHRRRRRHRGPRDTQGGQQTSGADGGGESTPSGSD